MMEYKKEVAIKTKEYIDNNLDKNISLKQLSKISCCCIPIMQNSFKEMYGNTIIKYMQIKKLSIAKENLKNGHLVKETARIIGYSNPNAFSHAYKSYWGVCPLKDKTNGR